MHRVLLVLVGALLLAGCGARADAGGADDAVQGPWQLQSGTADGAELPQPHGATATLELAGDEARGTAFCNYWFATVRADGSAFSLDGIGQTEMGCAPDVMAAETAYLSALAAVAGMAVEGDLLVLTGDGVELRFAPVPAVPDSPLEGTRWVLESLVDELIASSTLREAVLLLDPGGRAEATTGCRTSTGTWRQEDGALVLDDLPLDDAACPPEVARQDEHVIAVLRSGPAVELSADRLTLTAPDGRGLVYRAEG